MHRRQPSDDLLVKPRKRNHRGRSLMISRFSISNLLFYRRSIVFRRVSLMGSIMCCQTSSLFSRRRWNYDVWKPRNTSTHWASRGEDLWECNRRRGKNSRTTVIDTLQTWLFCGTNQLSWGEESNGTQWHRQATKIPGTAEISRRRINRPSSIFLLHNTLELL